MSRRDEGSEGGISGPYFYAVGAIVVGSRTTANYAASSDLRASTCALTDPDSTFWVRIVLGFLAVLFGLTMFIVGSVLHRRSDT